MTGTVGLVTSDRYIMLTGREVSFCTRLAKQLLTFAGNRFEMTFTPHYWDEKSIHTECTSQLLHCSCDLQP